MTGLLGGTFDPPHFGHLVLALEARYRFNLDKVILVPSRHPPHKDGKHLSTFKHRMAMTQLAVEDSGFLTAADLESPTGPSWTVDLIENLTCQGFDICFIMGMDSLEDLHTWKDPHRISSSARIVVGTRPGFSTEGVDSELLALVEVFPIPGMMISSSDLRERFAEGANTRYLVPDRIIQYIEENDLYARG